MYSNFVYNQIQKDRFDLALTLKLDNLVQQDNSSPSICHLNLIFVQTFSWFQLLNRKELLPLSYIIQNMSITKIILQFLGCRLAKAILKISSI